MDKFVTEKNLYRFWILSCLLGALLPGLFLIVYGSYKHIPLTEMFFSQRERQYLGYFYFNVSGFLFLLLGRGWILPRLAPLVGWYQLPSERRARRIVLLFGLFLVFTYHTKLRSGVWMEGISGWDFRNYPESLAPATDSPHGKVMAPLAATVIPANAKWVHGTGVATRVVMLLHFANGQILPANYGLLDFVFPEYIFGDRFPIRNHQVLERALKQGLQYRRRGRQFLLPEAVSYPNHAVYMPISYQDYPPGSELQRISFWQITVLASENKMPEIINAEEVSSWAVAR